MKKRFVSSALAFVLAASLAVPAMAAQTDEEKTSMGTVVVDNVPGGAVSAYVDQDETRMYLPIGEEVELPEGTKVRFSSQSLYYYETERGADNPVYVRTECKKVTVATSQDADKAEETTGENGYVYGDYTVKAGETAHISASFKKVVDNEDDVEINLENGVFKTEAEATGAQVESVELVKYVDGKEVVVELPFSAVELVGARGKRIGDPYHKDIEDGKFKYNKETGAIIWDGSLEYGYYILEFKAVYEGKTYEDVDAYIYVGAHFSHNTLLGFYPYWKDNDSQSRITAGGVSYCTTQEGTADRLWKELESMLSERESRIKEYGMYNYEVFDGWYVNDNWDLVKVADSDKVEDIVSKNGHTSLYGRFKNAEGKLYSVNIARLDGEVADDNNKPSKPDVPDKTEEIKDAVDKLTQTTPPAADASKEEKDEFDAQVKAVADSIEAQVKAGKDIDSKIIADMEEVLKKAYGVEVEVDDEKGFKAEGLLLATGMTSYEATKDVSAVELYTKGQIATVSDATKDSKEKVKFELAARLVPKAREAAKEITSLKAPVTVTVPMPEYYIATTSDAKRDVVKSGSKELKMKLDGETITFTTTELGKFAVGVSGKDDNNNNGNRRPSSGGGGGSSSSSKKNTGASGTWEMLNGKWWFKYTDGTYPANKWEFINSKWYYFDGQGYMTTGWQLINGKWYFLDAVNGDMATGWKLDAADGRWYYLDAANGDMVTGWKQVGDKWYYLNGEANEIPTWNYNTETSAWEFAGSTLRPFGSMYADEMTPDGYRVNADGAWVTE